MTVEVIKKVGRIEARKGEYIALNIVSINEGHQLYDLARWDSEGKRIVGVFMEKHQLQELKTILAKI